LFDNQIIIPIFVNKSMCEGAHSKPMNVKLNQSVMLKLSQLEANKGQIAGLPKNPRIIKDEKFKKLVKSIEDNPEMTSLREILVFLHDDKYVVIGGNMRLKALKELGYKEAPCKIIPVGTTVEQLKAYTIKDNSGFGEWDFDMLSSDWDLSLLSDCAIDLPEIELPEEEKEVVEDDFSEEEAAQAESRVQRGDIWRLGEHRLMCGDSTDAECVKALMGGQMADMVFTDPPYNVAIGSKNKAINDNRVERGLKRTKAIEEDIANDKGMSDEEIGRTLWKPAFVNMLDNSKDSCAIYVTMPQGGTHMMMMMMMMAEAKWQVKHELIWVKNCPTFSMGRLNYDYQHEPIVYGWKKTHNWYGKGKFNKSIWNIDKPRKCDLHPTMKPVELVENALLNSSQKNDVVLDLFGGSGTTLIACEQLDRKCCTMEYDAHYCDVIIARWEKLTGKTAEKIN
jgi:site-specific DNA-methyltransferase (adenine-specific)